MTGFLFLSPFNLSGHIAKSVDTAAKGAPQSLTFAILLDFMFGGGVDGWGTLPYGPYRYAQPLRK